MKKFKSDWNLCLLLLLLFQLGIVAKSFRLSSMLLIEEKTIFNQLPMEKCSECHIRSCEPYKNCKGHEFNGFCVIFFRQPFNHLSSIFKLRIFVSFHFVTSPISSAENVVFVLSVLPLMKCCKHELIITTST